MGMESFNMPPVKKPETAPEAVSENGQEKLGDANINDPGVLEKLAKMLGCPVEEVDPFGDIENNKNFIDSGDAELQHGKPWNYVETKNKVILRIYTKDYPEDGKKKGDIIIDPLKN